MCPASETSTCESTFAAFCAHRIQGLGRSGAGWGAVLTTHPCPARWGSRAETSRLSHTVTGAKRTLKGAAGEPGGAAPHKGGGGVGKARREEAWRRRHQGRDFRETASAAFPVCLHPVLPETSRGGGQGGAGGHRYSSWTVPGTEAPLQQDPLSQARTLSPPLSHARDSAFTGPVRDDHSRPHAPTPVPGSRRRGGLQDRSRCI